MLSGMTASAQGIVVNKTDGTKVYYAAEEVESITTYGYDQTPANPGTAPSTVQAVDLGLSVKWASHNVGASKPEDYGGYYAWGETEEKGYYDWSTYIHCDGSDDTCHDIGFNISGTQYDVAHVKWGGSWRMPTQDEINELIDNCTYEWTALSGVRGGKFTSRKNGNWIFLPAAGRRWYDVLNDGGSYGYYWSGTLYESYASGAYSLSFYSGSIYWDTWDYRYGGPSVRPVTE